MEYYVVVEHDEKGGPVCKKLNGPNPSFDALADAGQMARWSFLPTLASGNRYRVYVYQHLSVPVPQGEKLEELNRRVVEYLSQFAEVKPTMLSRWVGGLVALMIFAALLIGNLRSLGPVLAVVIVALGVLLGYYARSRNKRI